MKVLHIAPSFYPAHIYGGPTYSVYGLCKALARNGEDVRVLTTDANGLNEVLTVEKNREVEVEENIRVRYCKRRIRHSVSPVLLRLLPAYVRWADLVHLEAVYSFPTIPTLLACRLMNKPVVWSPHGALQRWEGSTRPALKFVWEQICRVVAPKRLVLHVTSEDEDRESQKRFPSIEITMIPNAVEIPDRLTHMPGNGTLRLLCLGRLHPKKKIESLLSACKLLEIGLGKAWSLAIAGGGDKHYAEIIKSQIVELRLTDQVKMLGQVTGEAKQRLFENSDMVVVPSHTESFGMVIAEALAHGVPVIASKGTPWKRMEEKGCGLWVNNDPEILAEAIERMSKMPLREMGQRGREWMREEFDWELRAREMIECYGRLVGIS